MKCPVCDSAHVEIRGSWSARTGAWYGTRCYECGNRWTISATAYFAEFEHRAALVERTI